MKIIHTSDIHLYSPLTSRLDAEKIQKRKNELLRTFERMVEAGLSDGVRIFIIAGDLFDTQNINDRAWEHIFSVMENAKGMDFLYLTGNHEKDAISSYTRPLPKNLHLFSDEWTSYDYGYVCIYGKEKNEDGMFDNLICNPSVKNIVVLHGALTQSKGNDENIDLRDAKDRGIDYMALGHYHFYSEKQIDQRGVAVYSGTPEGRGFDEAHQCGYVLIDTDGNSITHRFIPFARRRIFDVESNISSAKNTTEVCTVIENDLCEADNGDIVRVTLTGERELSTFINLPLIEERFNSRFFCFEIKDSSKIKINPHDYEYDKTLKGEYIRTILQDESLDNREKDELIRLGLSALSGELENI